jgi:hypothetical protein
MRMQSIAVQNMERIINPCNHGILKIHELQGRELAPARVMVAEAMEIPQ